MLLQSHSDSKDLRKFVCSGVAQGPDWTTKCHCSLTCNGERHEGDCADECCEDAEWYQAELKLKEKPNQAPCFPFCKDKPNTITFPPCHPHCANPWKPWGDVNKRCCPNCNGNNFESGGESSAATTKGSTAATTKGSNAATTKRSTAAPKPSAAPSGGSSATPKPSGGGGGGSKQSDSGAKGCGDVAFHLILSLSLAYWLF